MARRETPFFSFVPRVERASVIPIVRQLYAHLRDAIMTGVLQSGERLPSTRLAAFEWRVSRGVVTEVYEMLIAEGFAFGRHGSGTYVSADLGPAVDRGQIHAEAQSVTPRRTVSRAADDIARLKTGFADFDQMPFVTGRVVYDDRTARILKRLASRHLDFREDGYGPSQGEASAREAIARHLTISRGVKCEPDQIFITSGTQQAIDMITRVLVTPGRSVLVEDPCYPSTLHTLLINGAVPVDMEIDESGVVTDRLLSLDGDYAAIYVTPSHQYPAGGALPLTRRLDLLSFAHARGSWIVEDDYDSEFRYEGPSLTALQGLDERGLVIYVGTFSKALLPSLRVGYFVSPRSVLDVFKAVRPAMDRFPPIFQQRLITDFLDGGYFPVHLRRLRDRYRASRDCLAGLLRDRCARHLNVVVPAQGIHLTATSTGTWYNDVLLAGVARREGVVVIPASPMMRSRKTDNLILGFSGLRDEEADIGTKRLADALRHVERLARR